MPFTDPVNRLLCVILIMIQVTSIAAFAVYTSVRWDVLPSDVSIQVTRLSAESDERTEKIFAELAELRLLIESKNAWQKEASAALIDIKATLKNNGIK